MKRLWWVLLALVLLGGCWDNPKPTAVVTPTTTEERFDKILKDTADDLELGAKVRTLVEQQHQPPTNTYNVEHILFGCLFVVLVAIMHHTVICVESNKKISG